MTSGTSVEAPGEEIAADERQRLAVDGLQPQRRMRPEDPEQAAQGLRRCADAGAAVVVIGGGTQLGLGAPPRRYDVAFLTEGLDRLLEYEPADLTCRVEAGRPVATLQAELGRQGQWLPLDPPQPARATIGGVVAANASGPARPRYGTVRDWVIGIAVAYPSGVVARAGGKVVKNVAGYDLMKLHTGALGTLGVIVEVNLKVQARPEHARGLAADFDRPEDAVACALVLTRQFLQPAVAAVVDRRARAPLGLPGDRGCTLALRLEGYRTEVDALVDLVAQAVREKGGRMQADEVAPAAFEGLRDWTTPSDPAQTVLCASGPRTGVAALLAAAGDGAAWVALPAAGLVQLRPAAADPAPLLTRLRQAAGADGQVVVLSAPPERKAGLDVFGPPPPGFPLMRALKQALDPQAVLNPGRFVGGL